jgi:hypothetical protein
MFNLLETMLIFLIIPSTAFSFCVFYIWGSKSIKKDFSTSLDPSDWLILGVTLSFLGIFFDNLFWLFLITNNYLFNTSFDFSELNIVASIISKEIFTLMAAFCHLKAYISLKKGSENFASKLWVISSLVGAVYVAVLSILKR